MRRLRESSRLAYDLVGRFKNSEAQAADAILSASEDTLQAVEPTGTATAGLLWWEKGQVAAVWCGDHNAYVLEGRVYTVSAWVAGAVGKLRGRRVLLWGHGWKRPEDGLKRKLRLGFYRLVDGLMVYGDQARELGISYGVPQEKIRVVYNSLYSGKQLPETSVRGSKPGERPVLIYSSRLTSRHRLDLLAEALRDWPEAQKPLVVVVGEGSERPRLEGVFDQAGVDAEFLGAVYDFDRLKELYSGADLALSIGGAGLNVIQALGFGVPVLAEAGHRDSSPEIEAVVESETGRYYEAGSATSLREVLLELLASPEELQQMGARGLQLIRRRYTAEAHAEAIENALEHFLQQNPA